MFNKNKKHNIDRDSVLQQYRSFVPPVFSNETKPSNCNNTLITGIEIKEFYENLVKDNNRSSKDKILKPANNDTIGQVKIKEEVEEYNSSSNLIYANDVVVRRLVNSLLRTSSSGNKKNVIQCIKNIKGYTDFIAILNGQDEFGWNAVMCAAAEGHLHIVKYLLKEGCEYINVKDNSGMDVFEICEQKNQFEIYVYLLENENKLKTNGIIPSHQRVTPVKTNSSIISCHQRSTSVKANSSIIPSHQRSTINRRRKNRYKTETINNDAEKTFIRCELCDSSFHQHEQVQHESSVIHIFNDKNKAVNNIYGIPDNNIGFQMMLRSGWNSNVGLGPDGCGRINPVKTVMKKNRHGLGLLKNDRKSFKFSDKKKHLLENSRIEKDKNWEMNMRRYMSSDF